MRSRTKMVITRKAFASRKAWNPWLLALAALLVVYQLSPFGVELAKVFASRISVATVTMLPDGDNTRGWTVLTDGNSDSETCDATHHWYCMNESGSPVTSDYINTGLSGTTGETEEYTTQNPTVDGTFLYSSAVRVKWHADTQACNGSGGCDSVTVNIFVNGALQTGQTTTLTTTPTTYTTSFTGNWSTVDDLRISFMRNRLGGGTPSGQDDDLRLYQAYAEVDCYITKNPPVLSLTGYVWENEDGSTADDSTQIAAGNTSISVPQGTRLNLRAQVKNTSKVYNTESLGLFYDKNDGIWSKVRQFEVKNTGTELSTAAIETTNDVGKYSSLSVDPSGKPWVSYYDTTNSGLRVANYVGTGGTGCASSAWTCTAVETTNDVGQYSSIAFDPSGAAWVSYYDANTNNDLRVAKFVGTGGTGCASSAWTCTAIETTNDVGQYSSIAFDPSGNMNVAYYDTAGGSGDVRVARYDRRGDITTGPLQRVAAGSATSESHADMSTATDAGNRDDADCVGGGTWNNGKVVGAEEAAGFTLADGTGTAQCTEVTFTVDLTNASPGTTYRFALATDDSSQPENGQWRGMATVGSGATPTITVIESSFKAAKDHTLRMTNCTDTNWGCEVVDSTSDVGAYSKIAIDQSGNPWIVYYDFTADDLRVAVYVGSGGTGCASAAWTCTTIVDDVGGYDPTGGDYLTTGMSFSPDGAAWILYHANPGALGEIKYAKYVGSSGTGCTSSAWTCGTIDSDAGSTSQADLAFDQAGRPLAVYQDSTNSLTIARYVGYGGTGCVTPDWQCESLDSDGEYPVIAVDDKTGVWIGYNANTADTLKVARYVGVGGTGCVNSAWTCSDIDDYAADIEDNALGIDPSSAPWMSYRISSTSDLMVAKYVGTGGTGCSATSSWTCTAVETTASVGENSAIAFDASGNAWVSYNFSDTEDIRVARYVTSGGTGCASSAWTCVTVDSANDVGRNGGTSIAFDHTGTPWLSYMDRTNWDFKVAKLHQPPAAPSAASYARFAPRNAQKSDARYRSTLGRVSAVGDGKCSGTADYLGTCALFHASGDYDTITAQANESPYLTFAFRYETTNELPVAQWVGSTTLAPDTAGTSGDISLQVYRYGSTNGWETIASNTTSSSCGDCSLSGQPTGTPSEYFYTEASGKYWVYFRLYQNPSVSSSVTLKTDQFKAATNEMRTRLGTFFVDGQQRPLNRY